MRGRQELNYQEWMIRRMRKGYIPYDDKRVKKYFDELTGATNQLLEANKRLIEMAQKV